MDKFGLNLVAIVTASFFWSTSAPVTKILLGSFPPFTLAFWRFLIASVIVLPVFLKTNKTPLKVLATMTFPVLFFSAGNIIFFYLGIPITSANSSNIIYSTAPLIVAVFSFFYLNEKLSARQVMGILIGFTGILSILITPILSGASVTDTFEGNLLITIAVICWAFYSLGSRKLALNKISVTAITAMSLFVNCLTFLVLAIIFQEDPSWTRLIVPFNLGLLFYHGLFVTVITFFLYQWVINRASATVASLNLFMTPVFGYFLNFLILNEKMHLNLMFGSLLVFGGLYLAAFKYNRT